MDRDLIQDIQSDSPRFSVVVVTYNSAATVLDCIGSLSGIPDIEIIVVDNSSSDDTRILLAQHFPFVSVPGRDRLLGIDMHEVVYMVHDEWSAELHAGNIEDVALPIIAPA